jgi:hypothetical protein
VLNTGAVNSIKEVRSGDSIQDAVDASPGAVRIHADYDPSVETLPILVTEPIPIMGVGRTQVELDFTSNTTDAVFKFEDAKNEREQNPYLGNVVIRGGTYPVLVNDTNNLTLEGVVAREGSKDGIRFTADTRSSFSMTLKDCRAQNNDRHGINIDGTGSANGNNCRIFGGQANNNGARGLYIQAGRDVLIIGLDAESNERYGIELTSETMRVIGGYFEDNSTGGIAEINVSGATGGIRDAHFNGVGGNDSAVYVNNIEDFCVQNITAANYSSEIVKVTSNATDARIDTDTITILAGTPTNGKLSDNGTGTSTSSWV